MQGSYSIADKQLSPIPDRPLSAIQGKPTEIVGYLFDGADPVHLNPQNPHKILPLKTPNLVSSTHDTLLEIPT